MPILETKLDTRSDTFQQNRSDMLEMLGTIDELLEESAQGGGEEAIKRLRSRGKMPLRERISLLIDRDSPFLEISPLAAWYSNYKVGSGFLVGVGVISDIECLILGHDPSVRAGAFNPFNSKKLMRGLQIARENRIPYVQLVESAGADLRGDSHGDPEGAMKRERSTSRNRDGSSTKFPNFPKCASPRSPSYSARRPPAVRTNQV